MPPLDDVYIMYYRHGMNSALTKFFSVVGGLAVARTRAAEFCKIVNYKLLNVTPILSDLVAEENAHMGVVNTTPDKSQLMPAPPAVVAKK